MGGREGMKSPDGTHSIRRSALLVSSTGLAVLLLMSALVLPTTDAAESRSIVYPDPPIPKFRMYLENRGDYYVGFPSTNETLWVTAVGSVMLSSPVVDGYRLYVGTMGGSVLCLSATSGSVLWEYEAEGPIESTPAVDGGRVYVGSDDRRLYCLDATTGGQLWEAVTGGEVKSSPAVWDGRVYVGSNDYAIHCFNATTGAQLWNFSTGGWIYSSPAIWEGRIYAGSCDGRLYCLDALTGAELWSFEAQYMPASPAILDGVVVVGAYDDTLYAINATDGQELWNVSIGDGGIYSSAALNGHSSADSILAFVGDNAGRLFGVFNGVVFRTWELAGAVKSSPVLVRTLSDEVPQSPPHDAVIVGVDEGELVAVNPWHNASDPSFGPEYWWRLGLGTSITSSPFLSNGRVYISATVDDEGLVACIGMLGPSEFVVVVDSPDPGVHVYKWVNVSFHADGLEGSDASVLIRNMSFPAVWDQGGWTASVGTLKIEGPLRMVARVHSPGGDVVAEDSIEVVLRQPDGERPKVVIDSPESGERADEVFVASGTYGGPYPPLRLEWSWGSSGCWTAFQAKRNWSVPLVTSDLADGEHTLRVRAYDGLFYVESSVKVAVGEEEIEDGVSWVDIVVTVLLIVVLIVLMLTRPRPPPKAAVPSPEPTGKE